MTGKATKSLRLGARRAGLDPEVVGSAALNIERAAGPHGEFLKRRGLLDAGCLAENRALIARLRVVGLATYKSPSPNSSVRAPTREQVYERDGHRCVICFSTQALTLDHWIPRSKGGKNTVENLKTMCSSCNHRKSNLMPRVFLAMDGAPGKHEHRMHLLTAYC